MVDLTPRSHCTRPLTDLIQFAWGALEMHCRSIRSVSSVTCVKKLRNVQRLRPQWIRRPIRSRAPYLRHALRHPSTDVYSVNAASEGTNSNPPTVCVWMMAGLSSLTWWALIGLWGQVGLHTCCKFSNQCAQATQAIAML